MVPHRAIQKRPGRLLAPTFRNCLSLVPVHPWSPGEAVICYIDRRSCSSFKSSRPYEYSHFSTDRITLLDLNERALLEQCRDDGAGLLLCRSIFQI